MQSSPPDTSRKAKPKASFPPGSAPTQNALVVQDLRPQRIVGRIWNKTAENPFHVEMFRAAAVYRPTGPVNVPIEFFVAQGLAEPLRIDTSGLRHLDGAHLSHYAVPSLARSIAARCVSAK